MSTTITPTEQNIEINVNNDVIDINVTNEIVDVNATTQQIDINVAGAYPIPNPVLSVFGRTGVVVATEGDYTLTQLGDVTLSSPSNGQVLKYNGTAWVNGTDAGGLTSVGLSMPTAFTVTNSPLTSNGTIAVTGAGTSAQYINGAGNLTSFPSLTGFVPYTGATANVDLGTHTLIAAKGTFSSSGSGDTVGITHSSGSGIALNITKGGSGEGLYINKTSGSGNAATIIGTLNATTLVKSGGTSSQYLMADGSVSTLTNPITGTGTSGQVAYFNGTSSLTSSATFAFTPTSQLLVNNSVTAASAIARGTNLTPTLTAAANFDVLVGLEINPTFTNGAFTNVNQIGLRINGGSSSEGTALSIRKYSNAVASTTIAGSYYLGLGQEEYTNNSYRLIGFGYHGLTPNRTHYPAYIGYQERTTSGSTFGDIIFGTRTATTDVEPSERMRIFSTGNVGINTGNTDAGFRLDVNGTARVSSDVTTNGRFIATSASLSAVTQYFALVRSGDGFTPFSVTSTTMTLNGVAFVMSGQGGGTIGSANSVGNATTYISFQGPTAGYTNATGTSGIIGISGGFNQTSGTGTFNSLTLNPTFNTTGTYSGILRGLFFNPTLTSTTGATIRAIETTTGDVLLGTTSGNVAIGTSTLATATELTLGGSQTASSAIARGQLLNTTLVAAANNDVLVGLDINPTFTNGAFTGVSNFGLRVNGRIVNTLGNNQVIFSSVSATTGWQVLTLQNTGANCTFGIEQSTGTALFGNSLAYATVLGTSNATALQFGTNALTRQTIFSNGNIGINTTTDAGFRLDVNGTARVQGNTRVDGNLEVFYTGLGTRNINFYQSFGSSNINAQISVDTGQNRVSILGVTNELDFVAIAANKAAGATSTDYALSVSSTTKGILFPRMTTTQKNAIRHFNSTSLNAGLVVYDTTLNKLSVYTGAAWETVTSL